MKCACCKEEVRTVDEDGICFGCAMVQHFAIIIEKQTDIAGDEAIDLACELADCARSLILDARDNGEATTFSPMSASGWSGLRKSTDA
jgi:hypothetical protein